MLPQSVRQVQLSIGPNCILVFYIEKTVYVYITEGRMVTYVPVCAQARHSGTVEPQVKDVTDSNPAFRACKESCFIMFVF